MAVVTPPMHHSFLDSLMVCPFGVTGPTMDADLLGGGFAVTAGGGPFGAAALSKGVIAFGGGFAAGFPTAFPSAFPWGDAALGWCRLCLRSCRRGTG